MNRCLTCGEPFEMSRCQRKKFCSRECQAYHYRHNRPERKPVPSPHDMNMAALAIFAQHGRTPTVARHRNWGNLYVTKPGEWLLDRDSAQCGTEAGYVRHVRHKEKACEACKEAHRIDVAQRRPSRAKAAA